MRSLEAVINFCPVSAATSKSWSARRHGIIRTTSVRISKPRKEDAPCRVSKSSNQRTRPAAAAERELEHTAAARGQEHIHYRLRRQSLLCPRRRDKGGAHRIARTDSPFRHHSARSDRQIHSRSFCRAVSVHDTRLSHYPAKPFSRHYE